MSAPLCQCGCGQPTNQVTETNRRLGLIRGEYHKYRLGHATRTASVDYIVNPLTGCWDWQLSKNENGYGYSKYKGRSCLAHRAAYMRKHGALPPGVVVRHKCDNRACINPDHLEAGSQADNISDCVSKGRHARCESNGHAKLTNDQVREIRATTWGKTTRSSIAKLYGVSRPTISRVLLGTHWRGA